MVIIEGFRDEVESCEINEEQSCHEAHAHAHSAVAVVAAVVVVHVVVLGLIGSLIVEPLEVGGLEGKWAGHLLPFVVVPVEILEEGVEFELVYVGRAYPQGRVEDQQSVDEVAEFGTDAERTKLIFYKR